MKLAVKYLKRVLKKLDFEDDQNEIKKAIKLIEQEQSITKKLKENGMRKTHISKFKKISKTVRDINLINQTAFFSKSRKREIVESRQLVARIYFDMYKEQYDSKHKCHNAISLFLMRDRVTILKGIEITHNVNYLDRKAKEIIQVLTKN